MRHMGWRSEVLHVLLLVLVISLGQREAARAMIRNTILEYSTPGGSSASRVEH